MEKNVLVRICEIVLSHLCVEGGEEGVQKIKVTQNSLKQHLGFGFFWNLAKFLNFERGHKHTTNQLANHMHRQTP